MGKKKAATHSQTGRKRMGRPPAVDGGKTAQLVLRMSPNYKDWLLRYVDFRRSDASVAIDQAVATQSKLDGFEEPPRR